MQDPVAVRLAANVRRLREARGLTQQQLADLCDVPRPTLANLESGSANPTLAVLLKVAAVLQTTIERLVESPPEPIRLLAAESLPSKKRGGGLSRELLPGHPTGLRWQRLRLELGAKYPLDSCPPGSHLRLYCEAGECLCPTGTRTWELSEGSCLVVEGEHRLVLQHRGRRPTVLFTLVVPGLGS